MDFNPPHLLVNSPLSGPFKLELREITEQTNQSCISFFMLRLEVSEWPEQHRPGEELLKTLIKYCNYQRWSFRAELVYFRFPEYLSSYLTLNL